MTWKQIAYMGYYYDYATFKTELTKLVEFGATHILLEFIQMDYEDEEYYTLVLYDSVKSWKALEEDQKNEIYTILKNVKLGFSFGGANSFSTEGVKAAINSPYKRYYSETIEPLTFQNLSDDLSKICEDSMISYIDLDIENIKECSYNDNDYDSLLDFIGNLSIELKKNNLLLSHAPQTPYFNNPNFGFIYNAIDYYYGTSIDFYNIQYYNVSLGAYKTFYSLFYIDTDQNGSILQIINSEETIKNFYPDIIVTETFKIPIEKIVLGKCVDGAQGGIPTDPNYNGNYITLYSINNNIEDPSMAYYLNITYDYQDPSGKDDSDYPKDLTEDEKFQLNEWILNAGVMVWLYLDDDQPTSETTQQELLNYFSNNSGGTCFLLGTNILCYQNNIEMEISIELLQNGDYVKTHKGEYKKIVFIGYNFYKNNLKNNIKVIKQNKISNDIPNKDLYLTSGHSLLFKDLKYVNVFYDKHYYPENEKIDDYYKIMTSQCFLCDDYDKNKKIEFYFHIVLENENLDGQYGIYANGVLCESMSYNHIPKSGLKKYEN